MVVNPSSLIPLYIQDRNLATTVSADGLAPKGARPSAGTVVSKKFDMFTPNFSGFQ